MMSTSLLGAHDSFSRGSRYPRELGNAFSNYAYIRRLFDTGRATSLEVGRHAGEAAVVTGSGPGLDTATERLAHFPGITVCDAEQFQTLIHERVRPTYLVVLEPETDPSEWSRVSHRGTTLITHPGVERRVLENWHGKFQFFLPLWPEIPFFERDLGLGYPWIPAQVEPFSCIQALKVGIASLLGADPVFLVGYEFTMAHAQRWSPKRPWGWERREYAMTPFSEWERVRAEKRFDRDCVYCAIRVRESDVVNVYDRDSQPLGNDPSLQALDSMSMEEFFLPRVQRMFHAKAVVNLKIDRALALSRRYGIAMRDGSIRFAHVLGPVEESLRPYLSVLEATGKIRSAQDTIEELKSRIGKDLWAEVGEVTHG